jgi:hypothetical protein
MDALLEDISGQDALPLLAFTLADLYNNKGADNELTLASYDRIGRMKGVIARTVDQVLAEAAAKGEAPTDQQARLRLARSAFGRAVERLWHSQRRGQVNGRQTAFPCTSARRALAELHSERARTATWAPLRAAIGRRWARMAASSR